MATGIIMADIAGHSLTADDQEFLKNPQIGGVILFARNVDSPAQVRALTDNIRMINPNILIAADQEGGRVARFRQGFSPLPAMGKLGKLYDQDPDKALDLAYDVGYLMACEVLAVGVDFSFAPVLDIDGCSLVIGDRAFHHDPQIIIQLSARFMSGMKMAGMATTGKHFPGHGSIAPDSHVSDATDERSFEEIWHCDMTTFVKNLAQLDAVMPAHVIYKKVDDKPAGFSKIWLQDILRDRLGFDGVIFSDDLSMKAAHVAGGVDMRIKSAIEAGCDMALVCNSRDDAVLAVQYAKTMNQRPHQRFARMKGNIPAWQGSLQATCRLFDYYPAALAHVGQAFFEVATPADKDPTIYTW